VDRRRLPPETPEKQGPPRSPKHGGGYWLPFEEAREYVRGLGLKNDAEWRESSKSSTRPNNIPKAPSQLYKEEWVSVGDWLGTGAETPGEREWLPFEQAREYMRGQGLRGYKDWREWMEAGKRPHNIPSAPHKVYKEEWRGLSDFLGAKKKGPAAYFPPFEEVRAYVRGLGCTSKRDFEARRRNGELKMKVPMNPERVYSESWVDWRDFLGENAHPDGRRWFLPFEEAREYARGLGLKSYSEWKEWSKAGNRPHYIPASPQPVYSAHWAGWGDFLGTGIVAPQNHAFLPFAEARGYVRGLGLKSTAEWAEWFQSGKRPANIPTNPSGVYKAEWRGFPDWLGTDTVAPQYRVFLPFKEAREYVRGLGFGSQKEFGEWSKTPARPHDIPTGPYSIYKEEWRGWSDWLGVKSRWTRPTLLAFLEDLRPRLGDLEETELYLILQQGGAMPGLQKALGKSTALGVLKDLKENDGRAIEEALEAAADEEIADSYVEDDLPAKEEDEALQEHTPEDEELKEDLLLSGGLASLATPEALRLVDDLAGMHYGLDDETAQYLVDNRIAGLWQAYADDGEVALDALRGEGGHYFRVIRGRFNAQLEGAKNLTIPAGWAFRPPGKEHEAPTPPNLMQRRTAHVLSVRKRLGNWSGVGSGKTLSGILASRVTDRKHSLVICNKATVPGWCREIRNAFPDSVVRTHVDGPIVGAHLYTVLNYEKFQQRNRRELVEDLISQQVDFVILDEVQFVKQRDKNVSARRQAIHALLSELEERNPDLHVLGMSATPVINTLTEARKLVEIVTGMTFADLSTQATVNNALAMHRTLKIYGLRYRPPYEIEIIPDTPTVVRNDLVDDLRAGDGVLHLEQTLLPPKLEAVREHIRPGTLIYTHYVDGMVNPIRSFVEGLGYTTGLYTGDDKTGLEDFLSGRADVLIGSKPVGTGLDGLQTRCDQIVMLSLPWTSAEYEQIIGRVRRQGSAFGSWRIVVPQVTLEHEGDVWSWDGRRMDTIRFKRTLSDCALDGKIPEVVRISPKELHDRGRKALEAWIMRVREGEAAIGVERPKLRIPLPPALKERLKVQRGDFATLNNRWVSSNSETVHTRLKEDPAEWYLYHTLYREAREGWSEVPALRIAEDLKGRPDLRVGDFGAGECLLRDALPNHDVVSLDHVAVDDGVIDCDMASTPLKDGELGVVVFSLSLMGRNWRDYLTEAHRTLRPFGLVFIAEPARRWEDGILEDALEAAGFDPLRTLHRGEFVYARGVKR
jgi:superfamily II DNA or RNA helicase